MDEPHVQEVAGYLVRWEKTGDQRWRGKLYRNPDILSELGGVERKLVSFVAVAYLTDWEGPRGWRMFLRLRRKNKGTSQRRVLFLTAYDVSVNSLSDAKERLKDILGNGLHAVVGEGWEL